MVGKVFNPGKILFNEQWDKGITGNNNWVSGGNNDDLSTKEVANGHLIMESTRYPEQDGNSRLNELVMNFTTDSNDGLLITPTTHVQFIFPKMSSTVADERHANHALVMHFNNGFKIEYSGDGRFCDWTDPDLLIPLNFEVDKIITDNIIERFESVNIQTPGPLYLQSIQFMQLAFWDPLGEYRFYMDVDAIRLFDTQREE